MTKTVLDIRSKIWNGITEATPILKGLSSADQTKAQALIDRIAKLRSEKIYTVSDRSAVDSPKLRRYKSIIAMIEGIKIASASKNKEAVERLFLSLPKDVRNELLWAIWVQDEINKEPNLGIHHSTLRIKESPFLLTAPTPHKILYIHGGTLLNQLYHSTREKLAIAMQEIRAQGVPETHAAHKKFRTMVSAKNLAEYDKITAIKPLVTEKMFREEFEVKFTDEIRHLLTLPTRVARLVSSGGSPTSPTTTSELYDIRGAQYRDGRTRFCVHAPHARSVQCQLTAFGRIEHNLIMEKHSDGTWSVETTLAAPGRTYVYKIVDRNGSVKEKVDPFSFDNTYVRELKRMQSVVIDRAKFTWTDGDWRAKRAATDALSSPLSIYEMHIKSWDKEGEMNVRKLAPRVASYCKDMGFTHVEIYGIMAHFWKGGRGYQVTNYFAPYHQSGSYDDLKYFINYLHKEDLGVIIDWIPTHYHADTGRINSYAASMHTFDGTDHLSSGPSCWGTRWVDYSKLEACRLMEASAMWWIKEIGADMLRVDAVTELIHRDGIDIPEGIDFLTELNRRVHTECPGVLMVAEATGWDTRVTKPLSSGGIGFDLNWNLGRSFDLKDYMRTPHMHRVDHHTKLTKVFEEGIRAWDKRIATHSHDDTDCGLDSHHKMLIKLGEKHASMFERFADVRNFFSWQIFGPTWGHMIHMGDELASHESWYGRFRKGKPGVHWECENDAKHVQVRSFLRDAIKVYKEHGDFWKHGGENSELLYSYAPNNVIAFSRGDTIVVQNNSKAGYDSYDILFDKTKKSPSFTHLVERLNSDHTVYGGSGKFLNDGKIYPLRDGSGQLLGIRVKLPPLATLVLLPGSSPG